MKLVTAYRWRDKTIKQDITEAFEETCDSDVDGQVERAHNIARTAVYKLGRLLQLLHAKGVLNDADVLSFMSGFEKAEDSE